MADKPVRADKASAVAELTDDFRNSAATVLTEYRGLTVKELTELRRSLGSEAKYAVAKNTLAKRAATDAGIEGLDALFTGPTALAFVKGDVVEAAKGLRAFAKAHPAVTSPLIGPRTMEQLDGSLRALEIKLTINFDPGGAGRAVDTVPWVGEVN